MPSRIRPGRLPDHSAHLHGSAARCAALPVLLLPLLLTACQRSEPTPPPAAHRPVIKSQTELEQERQTRIRSGQIRPTTMPVIVDAAEAAVRKAAAAQPGAAGTGAIQADMLTVNDHAITVAEVLYALREESAQIRSAQTTRGLAEWGQRAIRDLVRREIGSLLLYDEAVAGLGTQQVESLDKFVEGRLTDRISQEFGGRVARLEGHLAEQGLTIETYRAWLKRDAVVTQYSREKFLPRITVRRAELLAAWERERESLGTPARREFFVIAAPFVEFLSQGQTWDAVDDATRAAARLRAVRHIRAAQAALETRPFEDAAREFSRGVRAAEGGGWGFITKPLRPPYEEVSRRVFDFAEGQVGEPFETADGWYIVKCGKVEAEQSPGFADVQGDLRRKIENRRLDEMMGDYVLQLAAKATISSIDAFVEAAVLRMTAAPLGAGAPAGQAAPGTDGPRAQPPD